MTYARELRKLVGTRPLILPGAVVLILNEDKHVLLQQRLDRSWGLPGGLMEVGESLEETARREVKEETGLELGALELIEVCAGKDFHLKLAHGDEIYSVTVVYCAKQTKGEMIIDQVESIDLAYYPLEQLPENLTSGTSAFIEPYLKKAGLGAQNDN
ncbi:MutT/Nudix family protein [Bacillus sp. JCM 19046]|nr:MutT/Nudix family protein [Bacillus sp. JCM 19045]GAF18233.1 MutT/Nudix family protein [Bacillus sp. JCM 19046]